MTERINRKDLIVEIASKLFLKQGYEATSVRQIADEVGVTEAALYYHFKAGKQELLQAVFICQMPSFKQILDECQLADSLSDLMARFGKVLAQLAPQMTPRLSWLISEYPNLDAEKQNLIHLKFLAFHAGLSQQIHAFVPEEATAKTLAWTLICASLGHSQLFVSLDLQSSAEVQITDLMAHLGEALG